MLCTCVSIVLAIIKKKYESEGDLGSVAESSKGKQRTLGFGAKPKPLLAKEVLAVFREIVSNDYHDMMEAVLCASLSITRPSSGVHDGRTIAKVEGGQDQESCWFVRKDQRPSTSFEVSKENYALDLHSRPCSSRSHMPSP